MHLFRRVLLSLLMAGATAGTARSQAPEPSGYQLAPGDQIDVNVVGEPDLAEVFRIDSQGNINQKFLGLVPVAGKTIHEAERFLERQFVEKKFLRHPVVRIKLTAYAQRAVVVLGDVHNPGVVNLPPEAASLDILDVIAKCGGFTAHANRANVRVKRRGADDTDQILTVNVRHMITGRTADKFPIYPGDVITVD